jgi:signal transduction histidine kinase
MAGSGGPGVWTVRGSAPWVGIALGVAVLAVLAALRDLAPGGLTTAATMADLTVGVAFAIGALLAPAPRRARLPFVAVGLAWLVGSIVPELFLLYAAMLAVALTLFPRGRMSTRRDRVLVGLAVVSLVVLIPGVPTPLAGPSPRPVIGALLGVVAVTAGTGRRWERAATWYPLLAGGAVAGTITAGWLVETYAHQAYDPVLQGLLLDIVLLAVAIGFPVAAWAVGWERGQLADRLLAGDRGADLDSLVALLSDVLGDPSLRIEPPPADRARQDVGEVRPPASADRGAGSLIPVEDAAGLPLAAIAHGSVPALDDPDTRAAVVDAVRLAVLYDRAQQEQLVQLAELEAARRRLIDATDQQRSAIATQLRGDVLPAIEAAAAALQDAGSGERGDDVVEALETARLELEASAAEVIALTQGVPAATLGGGRLGDAIAALAVRCPIPVAIAVTPNAAADDEGESALFYVCSEAIANAIKHAVATRIAVELRAVDDGLELRVTDDGHGGADPAGSGLRGLADRLEACGGRRRVDSPPGAGTTVRGWVPAVAS